MTHMRDRRPRPVRVAHTVATALIATVLIAGGGALTLAPASAAPTTSGGDSVVTVRVGSDRDPAAVATPLAGVVLKLVDTSSGATLTTCTSDAAGNCSFTVDDTGVGGANRKRFYIEGVSAPAGYFVNPQIALGPLSPTAGSPIRSTTYRVQTPVLVAGQTYLSGRDFMTAAAPNPNPNPATSASYQTSTGVWQVSRDDPNTSNCGVRVAIMVDLSASVGSEFANLQAAARSIVNALAGTPSEVAVYWFSTNATKVQDLTSVSNTAGVNTVNAAIGRLPSPNGYTNWDAAFSRVAQNGIADKYNLAVMITDGNPTAIGSPNADTHGSTTGTHYSDVEAGVLSANAVKAEGTRVVAFGVGAGISGAADNVRAITGDGNYFQTPNYQSAADQLKTLALGPCKPTVSVVKEVLPSGATSTANGVPTGGWDFTASSGTAGVTVGGGSSSTSTTSDETGATTFPLSYPSGTSAASVTVAEKPSPAQSSDYTTYPANGFVPVCTDLDPAPGQPSSVPIVPSTTGPSFTVTAHADQAISCVVYNVEKPAPTIPPPAIVRIDKVWNVDGTSYPDGDQPDGISATLTIDGGPSDFGTSYDDDYVEGDTVAFHEATAVDLPLCRLTGSSTRVTGGTGAVNAAHDEYTLGAGTNIATITNDVSCESKLTLVKQVQGGSASPMEWTLHALAPDRATAGPDGTSGSAAATGIVTPYALYALAESGGSPLYAQVNDRDPAATVAGSTGSWYCEPLEHGTPEIGTDDSAVNGGIAVALGEWDRCTATNQTATLTLAKAVDNVGGGTLTPTDWTLEASPTGSTVPGLGSQTVTGSAAGTSFDVRPGTDYGLSEDGPAGYGLTSLQCDTGASGAFVAATSVTLPALGDITCQYTNTYHADPKYPAAEKVDGIEVADIPGYYPGDQITEIADTGSRSVPGLPELGSALLGSGLVLLGVAGWRRRTTRR